MKPPTKVTKHTPILTIKVKDVIITSNIGRNWSIEVTPVGFKSGTVKVRRGKQNTFLLQTPWDTKNPSEISVEIKLTEKDKISDIFGPKSFNLSVDKTLPIKSDPKDEGISGYRKGEKTISVIVKGNGGDTGKSAEVTVVFAWFLSSNFDDLVSYIYSEIVNNLETSEFASLKAHLAIANKLKPTSNYLLAILLKQAGIHLEVSNTSAYLNFTLLVGYDGSWDHKPAIYAKCGEWSLDAEKGMRYKFDIFSNIHYGYIGRAIGFNKDELLDGAGLAQALKDQNLKGIGENIFSLRKLDDPIDQEPIKLGIALWEKYKKVISRTVLLKKIRDKKEWKGGREMADEGIQRKS